MLSQIAINRSFQVITIASESTTDTIELCLTREQVSGKLKFHTFDNLSKNTQNGIISWLKSNYMKDIQVCYS
jgi:hypothetical protein